MRRVGRRAGWLLVYALGWSGLAHVGLLPSVLFPPPDVVIRAGWEALATGELVRHVSASLLRAAVGFVGGSVAGVLVGVAVGIWPAARRCVGPVIEMFRAVPALAWIPMVLMWFGIGEIGKFMLIGYSVFFIVYTYSARGVSSVDRRLVWAARSLGAGRRDVVWRVVVPASLPGIWTGLELAVGTAFSVLVAAELVAATSGLGWMITDARRFFRTDRVLLGMAVIGLVGAGCVKGLNRLGRALIKWRAG